MIASENHRRLSRSDLDQHSATNPIFVLVLHIFAFWKFIMYDDDDLNMVMIIKDDYHNYHDHADQTLNLFAMMMKIRTRSRD